MGLEANLRKDRRVSGAVLNPFSREELEAENAQLRAALAAAVIDAQRQTVHQATLAACPRALSVTAP